MITYAIRETPQGYRLTELEVVKVFSGELRKYSRDTLNMVYKKKEFAEKKAYAFYRHCYTGELKYFGVIGQNEYRGEVA